MSVTNSAKSVKRKGGARPADHPRRSDLAKRRKVAYALLRDSVRPDRSVERATGVSRGIVRLVREALSGVGLLAVGGRVKDRERYKGPTAVIGNARRSDGRGGEVQPRQR